MGKSDVLPGEQPGQLDWWQWAACRAADPDLFFPVSAVGPGREEVARAKAVCASCAVRRHCLQYALATRQAHGVWGGTTEDERRLAAGGQHPLARPLPPAPGPAPHGVSAHGAAQHGPGQQQGGAQRGPGRRAVPGQRGPGAPGR
jgi:WhiB family redox-sensing transcriptional regulator